MNPLVRVHQCPGGLIHLSIGGMTVRLDRDNFQIVARAIQATSARLLAVDARPQLTIVSK